MSGYTGTPGSLGFMQSRIADECLGGATTAQIQSAILDAIREVEDERFWFSEARYDTSPLTDANGFPILDGGGNVINGSPILTTIAPIKGVGIEFYPIPPSATAGSTLTLSRISHFDKLIIFAFGNRWALEYRTPQWFDDMSVSPTWNGLPTDWTLQADELRFYPIPDGAYPVYVVGTERFNQLVAAGDTNPWMVEGERYIRRRAEQILYRTVLRNRDMGDMLGSQLDPTSEIGIAWRALRRETMSRGGTKKIRVSSYF